jgi:aerobic carbon-monoxide dehydrogenase small subunit
MDDAPRRVALTVNGAPTHAWVPAHLTLLEALRDEFGTTDVKYGCGEGVCGTCTVLLDGELVNSCLTFAVQADGAEVVTLAGLVTDDGHLHPLQRCFLDNGASQCGFCTPGMILTALKYQQDGGSAERDEIRDALSGNLCRCTGYVKIVDAVEEFVAGAEPGSDR